MPPCSSTSKPDLVFFAQNQMLHQRVESRLGQIAELQFVHHGPSLTTVASEFPSRKVGV